MGTKHKTNIISGLYEVHWKIEMDTVVGLVKKPAKPIKSLGS